MVGGTASPTVSNCTFIDNSALNQGGGFVAFSYASPVVSNCLFSGNTADFAGGAVCVQQEGSVTVINCTMTDNQSPLGAAVFVWNSVADMTNTIIAFNNDGEAVHLYETTVVTFSYSDIYGNAGGDWTGDIADQLGQNGNISLDPLFVTGSLGECYLSHTACGQAADSPGVDAGDPASPMIQGTTRTDGVSDTGIVDMGYHYSAGGEAPGQLRLITGPGPGYDNPPLVRVFPAVEGAEFQYEFAAYGLSHYGVNVSCGEVTGDEQDEILTGAGPGDIYGPHVRGFQWDGTPLPGLSFLAYGTNKWGVNVAAGDLDNDGFDEIITGAGPGAVFGPHVRGWDYDGTPGVSPVPGVSFFAYGTPKWGVNVSAGDIDGDGYDEIVTGAGPGAIYGPHVRGWNVDGGTASAMPGVSFLAYGTNKFGVNVSCGDLNGDGIDEIVTGAGPGAVFGAHVRGWNYDGTAVTEIPGINFFAWPPSTVRCGVNVFAGADLDGNGRDELIVGCGPDPSAGTPIKVLIYDEGQVSEWFSLEAFPGMTHGTNVAAGRF